MFTTFEDNACRFDTLEDVKKKVSEMVLADCSINSSSIKVKSIKIEKPEGEWPLTDFTSW
jgi:hypothetical protein